MLPGLVVRRRRSPCSCSSLKGKCNEPWPLKNAFRRSRCNRPRPLPYCLHPQGLAPRKGRAYRELFQLVREHLGGAAGEDNTPEDEDHDE